MSLIDTIDDPVVKRLVRTQLGVALAGGRATYRPFDPVFFVKCAIDFAQRRRLVRTILNGDEPEGLRG